MVRRNDHVAFMAGAYVFPGGRVDEDDVAAGIALAPAAHRFTDLTAREEATFRAAAARELEEEVGVRIQHSDLVPLAHWVTPEVETRRYDTRFFLARMPEGQEASHDASETTELAWLTASDAIDRSRRGEILLPPPTWTTLRRLAAFDSTETLFEWAGRLAIVRIQPRVIDDGGRRMLTLPGDPSYPPIAGWDVPEETRFLLQEGRWRPVRP